MASQETLAESSHGSGPRPVGTPSITPERADGSNPSCRIRLRLCQETEDFTLFRHIIDTYHTYAPWKRSPGRKICWLIESTGSELLGAIGVHSAVLTAKPRDDFIGWDLGQKLLNLTKIANNYRFALKVKGIGSRVLSLLESEAKKRWKERYGERLVLLETYVQPPYKGTSYMAAHWTYVEMTKDFAVRRLPMSLWKRAGGERERLAKTNPRLAARKYASWNGDQVVKVTPTPKKLIFIRPLHRYWRRELLKCEQGNGQQSCLEEPGTKLLSQVSNLIGPSKAKPRDVLIQFRHSLAR